MNHQRSSTKTIEKKRKKTQLSKKNKLCIINEGEYFTWYLILIVITEYRRDPYLVKIFIKDRDRKCLRS